MSRLHVPPQTTPPIYYTCNSYGWLHMHCLQLPAPRREYVELMEATSAQGRDGWARFKLGYTRSRATVDIRVRCKAKHRTSSATPPCHPTYTCARVYADRGQECESVPQQRLSSTNQLPFSWLTTRTQDKRMRTQDLVTLKPCLLGLRTLSILAPHAEPRNLRGRTRTGPVHRIDCSRSDANMEHHYTQRAPLQLRYLSSIGVIL